jgi:hypothetical protein
MSIKLLLMSVVEVLNLLSVTLMDMFKLELESRLGLSTGDLIISLISAGISCCVDLLLKFKYLDFELSPYYLELSLLLLL